MKVRAVKETVNENPRAAVVKRLQNMAQLVRQRGTPDEALEALEWEKLLAKRLAEIEAGAVAQAA